MRFSCLSFGIFQDISTIVILHIFQFLLQWFIFGPSKMNILASIRFFILFVLFLIFIFPSKVSAQDLGKSFITIVNPVRFSSYTKDPALSLRKEYEEVSDRNLPATWLLTYDAITNESLFNVISLMDNKQEFGIFLEVTENFSNASKVQYNKTNSWHHANALFLSGYKQEDRKKLIDKVFLEFKNKLGYYPKPEYSQSSYKFLHMEKYLVDSKFPCIRRKNLPDTVINTTYNLSLTLLKEKLIKK